MKKWLKILLITLLVIFILLALIVGIGAYFITQTPVYQEAKVFAEENNLSLGDLNEIRKGELEGLCEGFECADYCGENVDECLDFCELNPENSLCVAAMKVFEHQ